MLAFVTYLLTMPLISLVAAETAQLTFQVQVAGIKWTSFRSWWCALSCLESKFGTKGLLCFYLTPPKLSKAYDSFQMVFVNVKAKCDGLSHLNRRLTVGWKKQQATKKSLGRKRAHTGYGEMMTLKSFCIYEGNLRRSIHTQAGHMPRGHLEKTLIAHISLLGSTQGGWRLKAEF